MDCLSSRFMAVNMHAESSIRSGPVAGDGPVGFGIGMGAGSRQRPQTSAALNGSSPMRSIIFPRRSPFLASFA